MPDEAAFVWRSLCDEIDVMRHQTPPEVVRLAAVAALARTCGARHRELRELRLRDVTLGAGGRLRIVRHPQKLSDPRGRLEVWPLADDARIVLKRWLAARERLVVGLDGEVTHLFVTVRASTSGRGEVKRAGLPIAANGLLTSWQRHIRRLNARYAGLREPLPVNFEEFRRLWR